MLHTPLDLFFLANLGQTLAENELPVARGIEVMKYLMECRLVLILSWQSVGQWQQQFNFR